MTTAVEARIPADGVAAAGQRARRGGPRRRLFAKYAAALVGLVSLVLLINGSLDVWFSYDEARDAAIRLQREKADAAAQRIEDYITEIEKQIGWTTATQWASSPIEQRRFDFGRLQRQVPAITELIQLDGQGHEQLEVSRLKMDVQSSGADYSADPRFTEALAKKVWFGPVYFRKESEPYMTMAVAQSGHNAGVTVAEVNLKLIWDVITAIKIGKTGYAYVVDDKGRLIAHPDISRVLRNTDLSGLPQVVAARAPGGGGTEPAAIVHNLDGHRVLSASSPIPRLGWLVFVEQPISEALAPLYTSLLQTGLLLLLGLVVAILAGLLLARRMTGPIRALDAGAARIGAGALDHRITVNTGDELEELAKRFNTMAADLQSSYADLEKKVEDRTAELKESLDQQTATAEVLGVINSSPGDLLPVFDAMLEKAIRLCEGIQGTLWTFSGERILLAASQGLSPDLIELLRETRQRQDPGERDPVRRVMRGERLVQVLDLTADRSHGPVFDAAAEHGGVRTIVVVGLFKETVPLGAFVISRPEVRPFTDKQIALLQNFAAQAVIAMENARLITETREALEQQTATAEVLGVINSSPGDLAPVFNAMLEKAIRLCEATFGGLTRVDGDRFHAVAMHSVPPAFAESMRQPRPIVPGQAHHRLLNGEDVVQVEDVTAEDIYRSGDPSRRALADLGGARTALWAALRKDNTLLGAFVVYRQEVRPFSDKQIALLQNFAAQAVIAMENARLITETREALEQQTATAEVLQVINSSPGDLGPVFDAMLEKAHSLCGAVHGALVLRDGENFRAVAARGLPEGFAERLRRGFPCAGNPVAEPLLAGAPFVQLDDMSRIDHPVAHAGAAAGLRTLMAVTLRKDGALLGWIVAARREVRAFSDKEIALLQNFAAQAVIAMENARLITETREALEQQTATAEVLGVINSSPGELAPVFDAMLEKAMRLCEAAFGVLRTYDGAQLNAVAMRGVPDAYADFAREPLRPGPETGLGRMLRGERVVHIADITADEVYRSSDRLRVATVELGGARTLLVVPLRTDDALLGVITIYRQEVRPFTEKQIVLLENFAAQAVIAMENARLITETREALEQQTATAEVLQVINSSPGDLAPVFDAILEKAHTLCGAAHGSLQLYDGENLRAVATHAVSDKFADVLRQGYRAADSPASRALIEGKPFAHIADCAAIDHPVFRSAAELAGIRTVLFVPLRRDDAFLGLISAARLEVRPFSEKQIALLQNFAAQAVIAMENARLITETREALDQQTATAEVLGVINSSPGDLAPVFDAMLEKATSLCEAAHGNLWTYDGERFHPTATHGNPRFAEWLRQHGPVQVAPGSIFERLLRGEALVHISDASARARENDNPYSRAVVELTGARTVLVVPLRKDTALLGAIFAYRQEVRPFSDKQIALLQNFAAQAVIAMENARLLDELRGRTHDLQESLEYQTATSDVLKVISQSGTDLGPVLEMLVATAARLCEAEQGVVFRLHENRHHLVASFGTEPEFKEFLLLNPFGVDRGTLSGRTLLERQVVHLEDAASDPEYTWSEAQQRGNLHTGLGVPLLREGNLLGVVVLYRSRVQPFTEKQIALVTTFADQAVIAIENARLLNDLQGRTRDLQESLEYQTATSDVLKVISQSGAELEPVLDTLVKTAARLCDAEMAVIHRREGEVYRPAAVLGFPPEFIAYLDAHPLAPGRGSIAGRVAMESRAIHIADVAADREYDLNQSILMAKQRTALGVPLLREGVPVGVIVLARTRVEPFSEKQIALVTTFADQAVIAIENARLFNALRARTAELGRSVDELQMLSEVGQAVSSTLDLRAVLSTILTRSVGLAGAEAGLIFRYSRPERAFRFVEAAGYTEAMLREVSALDIPENMTGMGEAIARRAPLQIPDLRERAPNPLRDQALAAGFRSVLIVPLVGADRILGTTILQRRATGEFPPETVQLMQTLASQSVLAIQNARLFREIADKSEQLALASEHKSQFLANMSHELRTPLNAILGYAELLVDGIYGVMTERPKGVLERIQNNGRHLLALINDVLDLAKIEAGQLTLTLEDYSLPEVVQTVVTATEPLATAKGLKLTAQVQDAMPMAHGDARRVSQVLLNLVGNAIKFTDTGEVEIRGAADRGQFVLEVRDTGPGIADADQERIFGEFQQIDNSNTRQKGGTGLGLAISKRMVEMQGGTISVDSVLGQGSTFRVVLPVHVDEMMEAAE